MKRKMIFPNLYIGTIIFLVAGFFLLSCQREVDGSLPGEVVEDTEGTVLWKHTIIDTTLPAGRDTLEKYLFDYDSRGRIAGITLLTRSDTSSSPEYTDTLTSEFFYQANDTLPYRIFSKSGDEYNSSVINTYFTFINGNLVSDSTDMNSITFIGPIQYKERHYYTYSGTSVNIRGRAIDDLGNVCETYYDISRTMSNKNILTEISTMSGCTTGGWDKQRAYDTHKNPLCFFNISMPSSVLHRTYFWTAPTNNITLQTSASMFDNITYTYTYNSNSLPSVVSKLDNTNGERLKGFFYYRN